jgi:hypothetical protein
MGQCQFMLENNEKNTKKNSVPLRFEDMGAQKCAALISFKGCLGNNKFTYILNNDK